MPNQRTCDRLTELFHVLPTCLLKHTFAPVVHSTDRRARTGIPGNPSDNGTLHRALGSGALCILILTCARRGHYPTLCSP